MHLSEEAKIDAHAIDTLMKAEWFFHAYGNHVPTGVHTLGGVFSQHMSLATVNDMMTQDMFRAAEEQISKVKSHADNTSALAGF